MPELILKTSVASKDVTLVLYIQVYPQWAANTPIANLGFIIYNRFSFYARLTAMSCSARFSGFGFDFCPNIHR